MRRIRRSASFGLVVSLAVASVLSSAAQSPAAAQSAACWSAASVEALPIRQQVGQLFMVGVPIAQAPRAVALIRDNSLAGVLVRGNPTVRQKPLIRSIVDAPSLVPPFVAVDEEGGRVQHLASLLGKLPSAAKMTATLTPDKVRALTKKHGIGMRALGFNMDFGPVVDLAGPPNNGIGDRAFSADPGVVSAYGQAFAQGLNDAGVYPVLKHFPGHGRASGDTHNMGAYTPEIASLRGADLIPFRNVFRSTRAGVMMSHLQIPDFGKAPASLSPEIIDDLLRKELGFEGLIVTDSLSMWAIRYHYDGAKAAELSLRAGADLLLFDDEPGISAIIDSLVAAAGKDKTLQPQITRGVLNILRAKGQPMCTAAFRVTPSTGKGPTTVPDSEA